MSHLYHITVRTGLEELELGNDKGGDEGVNEFESNKSEEISIIKKENESVKKELEEVRECYTATRENLRVTQNALEAARDNAEKANVESTNAKLQLKSCREDIERKELANKVSSALGDETAVDVMKQRIIG